MCGLVYEHNFLGQPVNNDILQMFDNQRSRGTEGFGLFDGKKMNMVHATKENKILKWLVRYDSDLILFHHRNPSSTINVKRAAHPFSTKDYFGDDQYILIHNGHVMNSYELFEKHQEQGIEYHSLLDDMTFNDSEALLWDFAQAVEKNEFSLDAYGAIAFICLKLHKGKLDKLYFARNHLNPLKMVRSKTAISLASEGEGEMVEVNTLHTWNYNTKRLTKRHLFIPTTKSFNSTPPSTGGYFGNYDDEPASAPSVGEVISGENMDWFNMKRQKLLNASANACSDNQINIFDYSPDDIVKLLKNYKPLQSEIQRVALDYLNVANGHFESAYFCLEADYIDLETKAQFLADYRYLRKLEQAQRYIENDPEYKNEHSMSTLWVKEENETTIPR